MLGSNAKAIKNMLDEFDTTAVSQGLSQDNEHRAMWLDINQVMLTSHGWWVTYQDKYRCSLCAEYSEVKTPYCPECGANMRVGR